MKKKKMITWEDLDDESENDENNNRCLIGDIESEYEVILDFEDLQDAYYELLKESNYIVHKLKDLRKKYVKLSNEQKNPGFDKLVKENCRLKAEKLQAETINETLQF